MVDTPTLTKYRVNRRTLSPRSVKISGLKLLKRPPCTATMSNQDEKGAETPPTERPCPEMTKNKKPVSFYLSFFSLLIMVFLVSLDSTTLAVALPILARELGGSTLEAFWANICFMLAVVVFQPVYMTTSDVIGRKIPLYTAFLLFFVGSLVFALAPNMAVVILGRTLQGLGGSGLDVLNEIITADMTTMKERPLYLGLLAIPMAAGAILGPPVGALLSQYVSWRWIGWINLPLTALGFFLVVVFLKLRPLEGSFLEKVKGLDWVGIALVTIGCSAFVLPISWAGSMYSWGSWRTLVPLIIGALVLLIFGVYERRPKQPVVPHRLFGSATAIATLFGAFIHGLIVYGLNAYLPLFFQAAGLESTLESAVTMLPFNILTLVFSCVSPAVVSRWRKYLWLIWVGWVSLVVGMGLLSLIGEGDSRAFRMGIPVVASIGMGVLFTVLIIPMQASVSNVDDTGLAVGLLVCFRLFGGLLGLALGATVFSSIFERSVAAIDHLPSSLSAFEDSSGAIGLIPVLREIQSELPPEKLAAVVEAYSKSFRVIWQVMIGFAGVGFIASLFTKEMTIEGEEFGRQRFESS